MQRGEIWFASAPGGDGPVLILTRDPIADRIGSLVVAALTRTQRGLVSELGLTPSEDGVPRGWPSLFDHLHESRISPDHAGNVARVRTLGRLRECTCQSLDYVELAAAT
jgi:mRNA-degrading endonuclease toxin of MazEF toxin-antitoxin module